MDIIHIVGFETCTFFYQAVIYSSVLKKYKMCKDYKIKSFQTREDFMNWLSDFTSKYNIEHKTSPIVFKSTETDIDLINEKNIEFIGGCSDVQKLPLKNETESNIPLI
jgi:hypothetical protein